MSRLQPFQLSMVVEQALQGMTLVSRHLVWSLGSS
jgi:hypothetical protein